MMLENILGALASYNTPELLTSAVAIVHISVMLMYLGVGVNLIYSVTYAKHILFSLNWRCPLIISYTHSVTVTQLTFIRITMAQATLHNSCRDGEMIGNLQGPL